MERDRRARLKEKNEWNGSAFTCRFAKSHFGNERYICQCPDSVRFERDCSHFTRKSFCRVWEIKEGVKK